MSELLQQEMLKHSLEYMDCRQSLFSAQKGKCSICGEDFESAEEVGCCLKKTTDNGGREQYNNMVLVKTKYLPLICEKDTSILQKHLDAIKPEKKQLAKINKLRELRGLGNIG